MLQVCPKRSSPIAFGRYRRRAQAIPPHAVGVAHRKHFEALHRRQLLDRVIGLDDFALSCYFVSSGPALALQLLATG